MADTSPQNTDSNEEVKPNTPEKEPSTPPKAEQKPDDSGKEETEKSKPSTPTKHGGDGNPVIHTEELGEGMSKEDIRQKVWHYLTDNNLVLFPRPVFNRIPNFKGAQIAAEKLCGIQDWKSAKTVKINPDKPQEDVRYRTLEAKKALLVPTPRLTTGLFNKIIPPHDCNKAMLRRCSTNQGIREYSVPVTFDASLKVDLIVIGSVAVSKTGIRIGKGEGFADLEYAMMRQQGAVSEDTLVITTVHDCQVVDIPENLMVAHDVPVDIIVTPNHIHYCPKRSKPTGIIWSELPLSKVDRIPVLKQIRERLKDENVDVELAEEPEAEGGDGDGPIDGEGKEKGGERERNGQKHRPPYRRGDPRGRGRRRGRGNYSNGKPNHSPNTIFVGHVPSNLRVKEFKKQVREKGVEPYRVIWHGHRGFAFLEFQTPEDFEKAFETLQDFKVVVEIRHKGEEEVQLQERPVKIDRSKWGSHHENDESGIDVKSEGESKLEGPASPPIKKVIDDSIPAPQEVKAN